MQHPSARLLHVFSLALPAHSPLPSRNTLLALLSSPRPHLPSHKLLSSPAGEEYERGKREGAAATEAGTEALLCAGATGAAPWRVVVLCR